LEGANFSSRTRFAGFVIPTYGLWGERRWNLLARRLLLGSKSGEPVAVVQLLSSLRRHAFWLKQGRPSLTSPGQAQRGSFQTKCTSLPLRLVVLEEVAIPSGGDRYACDELWHNG
jgi:hypothetical protein